MTQSPEHSMVDVALYACTCGFLTIPYGPLLEGAHGRVTPQTPGK
jgi:hypothetical protein